MWLLGVPGHHFDALTCKGFQNYWPLSRENHPSQCNSLYKGLVMRRFNFSFCILNKQFNKHSSRRWFQSHDEKEKTLLVSHYICPWTECEHVRFEDIIMFFILVDGLFWIRPVRLCSCWCIDTSNQNLFHIPMISLQILRLNYYIRKACNLSFPCIWL